ncbi:nuclear RNA export factor 1-like [Onthophagus taurus]|uniref:nuclear RNA export factor 1-like n=1 Tax=Onthophagus taurus TaxID=166361 RepID=UPI0039BDAD2D
MSKPGKKFLNHVDHGFRQYKGERHVSFKSNKGAPHKNKKFNFKKDWANSVRYHLADEDIDMGGSSNAKVIFPKRNKRRDGQSGTTFQRGKKKLLEGPMNWYRVTLPYGNKYEKNFVLKKIGEKLEPTSFIPIMWQVNGQSATFYVDDFKTANQINEIDRDIQMPDGFNLFIRVNTGCPNVDITNDMKEKMKMAMGKRYNAATKALDLTKFHADPDLQHIFCALFKPIILLSVIDIISENIPELEALNLFDNNIHMLGHLKKMSQKLPNLKILHMGKNKLKDVLQLDALSGLPIVDLVLDGNPLCDAFQEKESYISEVRKRFPKVVKLDGIDLPPPISFDITTETTMPEFQQTYLCNPEGQAVIAQFLEQYFQLMDSDDRSPLQAAYHEQAMYSMTMAYAYGQHPKNSPWLNWYNTDNRNLKKITDSDRRFKLLKQGQSSIISFLKDMPSTKHDIMNFTVDLNLCTPQMLLLTVSGIFKELRTGHKQPPVRYFFRTLVIVPQGAGFCIANEEFHISNAKEPQIKQAFKTPMPSNRLPDVAAVVPIQQPTIDAKKQMVEAVSQQSGMNLEWSEKCLQDSNWDFQTAIFAFGQAQKDGKIPPEAFVK